MAKTKKTSTSECSPLQRCIEVWESAYNAKKLSENHYNFQIAKSVITGTGGTTCNVVWQSRSIAPKTSISWKNIYGLNWTAKMPAAGLPVTLSGNWQACSIGDIYDLDKNGFWIEAELADNGDAKFMNVGKVNYTHPDGGHGIHIVVGVQKDASPNSPNYKNFDPIYVDPITTPVGSCAKYQPQEFVTWWYQTNMRTSTMIEEPSTAKESINFLTAPETGKFYYSTTFNFKSGNWITSPNAPKPNLYAPASANYTEESVYDYGLLPAMLDIALSVAVPDAVQEILKTKLQAALELRFGGVLVKFLDKATMHVQLGSVKEAEAHSDDWFAVRQDKTEKFVVDCFKLVVDGNHLLDGEDWDVGFISVY